MVHVSLQFVPYVVLVSISAVIIPLGCLLDGLSCWLHGHCAIHLEFQWERQSINHLMVFYPNPSAAWTRPSLCPNFQRIVYVQQHAQHFQKQWGIPGAAATGMTYLEERAGSLLCFCEACVAWRKQVGTQPSIPHLACLLPINTFTPHLSWGAQGA